MSYAAAAVKPSQTEGKEEKHSKDVDWLNLPCPVKYEEIQRENISKIRGLILIPCLSLVPCQGVGLI